MQHMQRNRSNSCNRWTGCTDNTIGTIRGFIYMTEYTCTEKSSVLLFHFQSKICFFCLMGNFEGLPFFIQQKKRKKIGWNYVIQQKIKRILFDYKQVSLHRAASFSSGEESEIHVNLSDRHSAEIKVNRSCQELAVTESFHYNFALGLYIK